VLNSIKKIKFFAQEAFPFISFYFMNEKFELRLATERSSE